MPPFCQIEIADSAFDPEARIAQFRQQLGNIGGLVSFTGIVRDITSDNQAVAALTLEHYPAMTAPDIQTFVDAEVFAKWTLAGLLIIHRIGTMQPQEPVVLVAAASAHRREAFEATDCVMDYLKSRALFWKKEQRDDGAKWIQPSQRDQKDAQRWVSTD